MWFDKAARDGRCLCLHASSPQGPDKAPIRAPNEKASKRIIICDSQVSILGGLVNLTHLFKPHKS